MKDVVAKMLKYPFSTCMIITATANGIANIVCAVRGKGRVAPANGVLTLNIAIPEKKPSTTPKAN